MKKPSIRITDLGWINAEGIPELPKVSIKDLPNPPKPKIKKPEPLGSTISPRLLYEQQQAAKLNPHNTVSPPDQNLPLPLPVSGSGSASDLISDEMDENGMVTRPRLTPQDAVEESDDDRPKFIAANNSPHHKAMVKQLIQANKLPDPAQADVSPINANGKQAVVEEEINYNPKYIYVRQNPDLRFMRVALPSEFIFYDFDDIQMRPFEVGDLIKLSRAQQEHNPSIMIDVLAGVIDQDIRDLTVPDMYYLMYMERIWSYPKSPFTLKWKSKYGNNNEHTIHQTNLKITKPTITKEKYMEWRARGYCVPTVRDMEVFQAEVLDPEFRWKFERAQYLVGNTIAEKVARLDAPDGIEVLENVRDFSKLLDHGVKEHIDTVDAAYNPRQHIITLEDQMKQLELADYKKNLELIAAYNKIKQERDTLLHKVKHGIPCPPDKEVIRISVDIMSFFPGI